MSHSYKLRRALRSCRTCDRCVYGFDHHCGILGVCIAAGNQRNFVRLVSCGLVSCGIGSVTTVARLLLEGNRGQLGWSEVHFMLHFVLPAWGYTSSTLGLALLLHLQLRSLATGRRSADEARRMLDACRSMRCNTRGRVHVCAPVRSTSGAGEWGGEKRVTMSSH